MRDKYILAVSLLILTVSCGGGDGGGGVKPVSSLNKNEAQLVFIQSLNGGVTEPAIGTAGLLGNLSSALSRGGIPEGQPVSFPCSGGGNIELNRQGTTINFTLNNCTGSDGCSANGSGVLTYTDTEGDGHINSGQITWKAGFQSECANAGKSLKVLEDIVISFEGPNGGNILQSTNQVNMSLTIQKGKFEFTYNNATSTYTFSNLKFTVSGTLDASGNFSPSSFTVNGNVNYSDSFCTNREVSLSFNTLQDIGYPLVNNCPSSGSISLNNGLLEVNYSSGNITVKYQGSEIFNDSCSNYQPPASCQ